MSAAPLEAQLAIVGFGFSGLATLLALQRPLRAVVIALDASGLGLAYATTNTAHLLNVPAGRMGARDADPGGFVAWSEGAGGVAACARLGVPAPGPEDFAPRALYGAYLSELRASLAPIRVLAGTATGIRRVNGGWVVRSPAGEVRSRRVVLATGNEHRCVFGDLRHPGLRDGPWRLTTADLAGEGPVVLIGSGLTAVDALLSVRSLGYTGPIVALSRGGRLPAAHRPGVEPLRLTAAQLQELDSVAGIVELIGGTRPDWRAAMDGLRPCTQEVWRRLPAAEQLTAARDWAGTWNVHRHRMAPSVAATVKGELAAGSFNVTATTAITPVVAGTRLRIDYTDRGGAVHTLEPRLVIDCTGPQLDPRQSAQPLLRGLVADGIAAVHHTGLGLAADADHQIADGIHAIGSLLTGQLWESVAVPELREQAATIAARMRGSARPMQIGPVLDPDGGDFAGRGVDAVDDQVDRMERQGRPGAR